MTGMHHTKAGEEHHIPATGEHVAHPPSKRVTILNLLVVIGGVIVIVVLLALVVYFATNWEYASVLKGEGVV